MPKLTITRGLPASGKTTWARAALAAVSPGSTVRLNRDDLRRMALPTGYRNPEYDAEQRISLVRDAGLVGLLKAGCDVIVDDTNLRAKYVRGLMEIADRAGAEVEFQDFTDVPVAECIRRDAARPERERVGATVIQGMYDRYLAQLNGKPPPVLQLTDRLAAGVYEAKPETPRAVLVDIDGTVALMGDRSPYDETCVANDLPNERVIETVRTFVAAGCTPIFMSGRTRGCQEATQEWLRRFVCDRGELHMRTVGDSRPDHVVKLELFNEYVRDRYDVRVVLDDRDQVVTLWRSMGLTCLQVAPGDF